MSDSRIPLLSSEAASAAASEVSLPDALAQLNIFRVLLHDPKVAKGVGDLLLTMLFGGQLEARLRELVIMRIGWVSGAVYEWTQHWRIALELGVPEADLLAVRDWPDHAAFSEADRVALQATDEMLENGVVSPETWARIEATLPGPAECIELLPAIGLWHLVSQFLRSVQIPLEEGVASWPPDGRVPPAAS